MSFSFIPHPQEKPTYFQCSDCDFYANNSQSTHSSPPLRKFTISTPKRKCITFLHKLVFSSFEIYFILSCIYLLWYVSVDFQLSLFLSNYTCQSESMSTGISLCIFIPIPLYHLGCA